MTTALLTASRSAAATYAELGTMAVNEQVEALELSATDPMAELVVSVGRARGSKWSGLPRHEIGLSLDHDGPPVTMFSTVLHLR